MVPTWGFKLFFSCVDHIMLGVREKSENFNRGSLFSGFQERAKIPTSNKTVMIYFWCDNRPLTDHHMGGSVVRHWRQSGEALSHSDPTCYGCHHKGPQTGQLQLQNLFSHNSEDQKSKIRVLTGLVSSETSLLDSQMATFAVCACKVSSLPVPGVLSVRISSYRGDTSQIGLEPSITASF